MKTAKSLFMLLAIALLIPSLGRAQIAVWLDGSLSDGGNAIPGRINALSLGGATLVTTAQLETAGFLNSFKAIVVSRYDASFGTPLSALAAANVAAWVGSGPSQGGVAVFTNDMSDNLLGAGVGDPFDPNLDALFVNAITFAAASGHGFVGEFNGAVMAMASNDMGWPAMGLLNGHAGSLPGAYGPQFQYAVGPIGGSNPIDNGVTFPFTDTDTSTFLTRVTGADPGNIVDIYVDTLPVGAGSINGLPAVLANSVVIHGGDVPDAASSLLLVFVGLACLVGLRRRL